MTPQPTAAVVAPNLPASSIAEPKGKSREEPITIPDDLPENLTHTAQVALPKSDLAKEPPALEEKEMEDNGFGPMYAGMTEQEVFDAVTRPDDIPGMPNWGIPPPVDTKECSPQLKVGFLKDLDGGFQQGFYSPTPRYHIIEERELTSGQSRPVFITEVLEESTHKHLSPLFLHLPQSAHILQTRRIRRPR